MLRRLEFLVPPLLKRIDRQLLLNRPGLWATRIHYVAFYGSIVGLLMGLYTMIHPVSLQSIPDPDVFTLILSIPVILGFLGWVYYLTFFRLEKHKGHNWQLNSLRDELLHIGMIGFLTAIPILFGYQLSNRVSAEISYDELVSDINTLKMGSQYFSSGVYSYSNHYYWEIEDLAYQSFGLEGELFGYEISQQTPRSSCRKRQSITDFLFVYEKYTGFTIPLSSREILRHYREETNIFVPDLENSGRLLVNNLTHLANAKRKGFVIQQDDFLRFFIFLACMLWLGLQTFLKTNWKLFVGALLLGMGGAFFIGISTALLEAGFDLSPRQPINLLILTGILTLLYQGYRQRNTKRTNQWKSVSLILGTLLIPLIPLNIASIIDFNSVQSDSMVFNLLYAGIAVAFISWNLTLRSRFVDLSATPKDN